MTKIAVILFPGMNCEDETKRACEAAGMEAEIVRWNTNSDYLEKFDGYVLIGGWAHEDRIRAGVIAAKDPIMDKIKEEGKKGKVVMGICNGAQVLVESGMVPGIEFGKVEMALAPNINPLVSGYYCTRVMVRSDTKKKNAFNLFTGNDDVLKIPIAHGEGRFTTKDKKMLKNLIDNGQIVLRYCDTDGNFTDNFPINPNGAMHNIAAVCNPEGNVMAIMPHPERAAWLRQIPGNEGKTFEELEGEGPGRKIFKSIKKYIKARKGRQK